MKLLTYDRKRWNRVKNKQKYMDDQYNSFHSVKPGRCNLFPSLLDDIDSDGWYSNARKVAD